MAPKRTPIARRLQLRRIFIALVVIYALVWAPTVVKIQLPSGSFLLLQDADPCQECFSIDMDERCDPSPDVDPECQRFFWKQRSIPANPDLGIPAAVENALVFDLNCRHPYRYDYYHFLHDCSVPLMPALGLAQRLAKADPPGAFVSIHHKAMQDAMMQVLPEMFTQPIFVVDGKATQKSHGLVYAEGITFEEANMAQLFVRRNNTLYQKCNPCYRHHVHKAYGIEPRPVASNDRILVLWRDAAWRGKNAGGRAILDHDYLVSSLASKFKGNTVTVHYGNETMAETVKLFSSAAVMIGYHGAGMVNSVFMRKGALVIEITTFTDKPSTGSLEVWRANMPDVHHGLGVDYSLHLVDHHHLWPRLADNITDWDHTLKPENVRLSREHVYLVLEKTQRFLDGLDARQLS